VSALYYAMSTDYFRQIHTRTWNKIKITILRSSPPLVMEGDVEKLLLSPKAREQWIDMEESRGFSDYGDNTCPENKHAAYLKTILKRWDEISLAQNIPYFLTCGTLLGAWRTGDLVPLDRDLDVLVARTDAWKLFSIMEKSNFNIYDNKFHLYVHRDWPKPYKERRRFKCNGKRTDKYSDQCSFLEPMGRFIWRRLHVDIYDYTIQNGHVVDPSEGYHEFDVNDVFPLRKCLFMGLEKHCPYKSKLFLESFYGQNLMPNKVCSNGSWIKVK